MFSAASSGSRAKRSSPRVYDPAADAWEVLPDLKTPRHGAAAAGIEGHIFVFGGANKTGAGDVAVNEVLAVLP